MNMEEKTWRVLMILTGFPSTFLAWLVGTWNCKPQRLRRLWWAARALSMTQRKAVDKRCLRAPSVPATGSVDRPRAPVAWPPAPAARPWRWAGTDWSQSTRSAGGSSAAHLGWPVWLGPSRGRRRRHLARELRGSCPGGRAHSSAPGERNGPSAPGDLATPLPGAHSSAHRPPSRCSKRGAVLKLSTATSFSSTTELR